MWSLLRLGEWKVAKMITVHWPRWLPCPYMVKTFKNLLLQNQISPGAFAQILGDRRSTKIAKMMVLHWHLTFFRQGQICFPCICMGPIHLYGKILRIHILDIFSLIQLNQNLMMSIKALMQWKLAKLKWVDRKSKMVTTAGILKLSFRQLFSNLRSLWAETCSLAIGWLLDRNKLNLCRPKIQDGRSGSAPLHKMATRATNRKSSNDI